MSEQYKEEINSRAINKMRLVIKRLPPYCASYFNAKNASLAPRTRLGYAEDLEIFFYFIKKNNPLYEKMSVCDIPLDCLKNISPSDIDEYLAYIEDYNMNDKHFTNGYSGKKRKLAAIRELYKYFCKVGYLDNNPASLVDTPKETIKKEIRALDNDEKMALIECISNDANLSKKQLEMKQILENRDYAMVLLFLGTGIRVSEIVGLDLSDVNIKYQFITILGKGGKYSQHFFNEDIKEALEIYLNETRSQLHPKENVNAFFLSIRGIRISVRSVENLVKNYANRSLDSNHGITPHKLRSTYGTDLYAETGDIALVSDNLGHADISTTKHYYAKQNIENMRKNKNFNIIKNK